MCSDNIYLLQVNMRTAVLLYVTSKQNKHWSIKAKSWKVLLVPVQGRVSTTCWGQLSWFSKDWIINVLDLDWRPIVSKLLPSMQVSSHVLHSDHSVKWQSPGGLRSTEQRKERENWPLTPFTCTGSRWDLCGGAVMGWVPETMHSTLINFLIRKY